MTWWGKGFCVQFSFRAGVLGRGLGMVVGVPVLGLLAWRERALAQEKGFGGLLGLPFCFNA